VRGPIPSASVFAGQPLPQALPGGMLVHCLDCLLTFRSPIHPRSFYDALYATAQAKEWDDGSARTDHRVIAHALQARLSQGDVLDIGCGSGGLLDRLPPGFRRFGIEISREARAIASSRGIQLIGSSFDDLGEIHARFDAVLACDVIEHHPQPQQFLRAAISLLKPGGLLLLSTGNPAAPLWRLSGGRFWYSQFAEHLTFVSPAWVQRHAGRHAVDEILPFAYGSLSLGQRLKTAVLCAYYAVAPGSYARQLARRIAWQGPLPYCPNPPGMGLSTDHFVAVVRSAPA
jgi:SAM-dependent methyltransferase